MKFTRKQKMLAKKYSFSDLANMYKGSEKYLQYCAHKGDKKGLEDTMKLHQNYEYALLYKNTPEYRSSLKNKIRRK